MHIQLSGCLRQIQIILKEVRMIASVSPSMESSDSSPKNFLDEHFTDGNRKLVEQSSNTESAISEDIAFGIENFTNLKSGACFFVCIGKIFQVICRVAVSNPGCVMASVPNISTSICAIFSRSSYVSADVSSRTMIMPRLSIEVMKSCVRAENIF